MSPTRMGWVGHTVTHRFEADIEPVSAHVALFGRMVFGVDEDGVVRTSRHIRLAADARLLVEVDDAVLALEHGLSRARRDAWCICALVAAGDLEGPPDLREDSDVRRLEVGAGHPERNLVLALARGRARARTNASGLVKHLDHTTRLLDFTHAMRRWRAGRLDTHRLFVTDTSSHCGPHPGRDDRAPPTARVTSTPPVRMTRPRAAPSASLGQG